jgi:hypothetical protein
MDRSEQSARDTVVNIVAYKGDQPATSGPSTPAILIAKA